MELTDIVAISAVRTPMGRFGGTLKDVAGVNDAKIRALALGAAIVSTF